MALGLSGAREAWACACCAEPRHRSIDEVEAGALLDAIVRADAAAGRLKIDRAPPAAGREPELSASARPVVDGDGRRAVESDADRVALDLDPTVWRRETDVSFLTGRDPAGEITGLLGEGPLRAKFVVVGAGNRCPAPGDLAYWVLKVGSGGDVLYGTGGFERDG